MLPTLSLIKYTHVTEDYILIHHTKQTLRLSIMVKVIRVINGYSPKRSAFKWYSLILEV